MSEGGSADVHAAVDRETGRAEPPDPFKRCPDEVVIHILSFVDELTLARYIW